MGHKENWEMIVDEIHRRRDAGEKLEDIGGLIGRKKSYVSRLLSGSYTGENVNADKIRLYMKGLGLPLEDEPIRDDILPPGFSLVRKVSARLGAGSSLMTEDETEGLYAFRDDFLLHFGQKSKLVLFGVMGNSMEPTLKNDDTILIDKADTKIRSGELYAVGIGDELHIKRVFVRPDEVIVLKSDNPDYPTWEVPKDERPRIIGRARWVGRML